MRDCSKLYDKHCDWLRQMLRAYGHVGYQEAVFVFFRSSSETRMPYCLRFIFFAKFHDIRFSEAHCSQPIAVFSRKRNLRSFFAKKGSKFFVQGFFGKVLETRKFTCFRSTFGHDITSFQFLVLNNPSIVIKKPLLDSELIFGFSIADSLVENVFLMFC